MPWNETVLYTLALVNIFVATEYLISVLVGRQVFTIAGTMTNISAYTIYLIIAAIYGYAEYLIMSYLQLSIGVPALAQTWWYWPTIILADDFCFYWFHRASHKIGLLWMSHVVHHSSNEFNLSVGLRQTWLPFLGILFWLPLALAGFKIEHILMVQAASLSYQFFMHTQLINLPRFWGGIFNTPSHHRVHHGMNPEYIDRNFAGAFIIWDRLFGTFTPEKNPVEFGIHEPAPRGEIIIAQFWGLLSFLRIPFARKRLRYENQSTSVLAACTILFAALLLFALVVNNPRWFI